MKWKPIETAPKDGTSFLGAWPSTMEKSGWFVQPCKFLDEFPVHDWDHCREVRPTLWMPIPYPKEQNKAKT